MNFRSTTLTGMALLATAGSLLAQDAATTAAAATPAPVIPPTPSAKSPWENSIGIGFSIAEGNTDNMLGTANFTSVYKGKSDEFGFGLDGKYGEQDDKKNTDTQSAYLQYNHLFTERFYLFGRGDFYRDSIAEIDYRFTVSAGPGYYLVKNANTRLNVEAGPGVVFQQVADESDTYATIRFGQQFEHKFNEGKTRIWEKCEYLPQVDRWGNYIINLEVGIETTVYKGLSLRTYVQDYYDSEPAPDRKSNDFFWITGIAYKF